MVVLNTTPLVFDARVRKEAESLAAAGHTVLLVGLRQRGELVPGDLGSFRTVTFELWARRLPRLPITWPVKYAEYLARAVVALLRNRADVYHAHDLDALVPAWIAARLARGRVVYDSHELFTERPIQMRVVWRLIERFLIRRVDAIIAASDERAEIMHREYGAEALPEVIINSPYRARAAASATIRDGLPEGLRDAKLVVYQGGLAPGRCLESLTLAAGLFDANTVLVFVGAPSAYTEAVLRPLIRTHNLADRVFIVPPVDASEVVSFISTANLGVVIYQNSCRNNYYCAPNKLFDYCMAGVPVVGCDFPPVRRVVREYGLGDLFDPERPVAIADAVNRLLGDPPALARAVAGCRRAAARFNWEAEAVKLEALYGRLARQ
jgi:glycosyltransferase involved in cell wall biosynthesis